MAKSKRANRRKSQELAKQQNVIEPDSEPEQMPEFEQDEHGLSGPIADSGDDDAEGEDIEDEEVEVVDNEDWEVDEERTKMEEAVWEAFREEFHEIVEQLPLYLHRQFMLLRELDEQSNQHSQNLYRQLNDYIKVRERWAASSRARARKAEPSVRDARLSPHYDAANPDATPVIDQEMVEEPTPHGQEDVNPALALGPSSSSKCEDGARDVDMDDPLPSLNATRTILARVGWSAEEALRTSNEKTSLSQTIYDAVQRHTRQLDQAIKEQEFVIKMGMRPGTHPALLEELTAPRWHKPHQQTLDSAADVAALNAQATADLPLDDVSTVSSKRSKKGKNSGAEAGPTQGGSGLKLKLRRLPAVTAPLDPESPVKADEEVFCTCQRPSFGLMVGCDNPKCENGSWFHAPCMGLSDPLPFGPDDAWYCPACAPLMKSSSRKRRRR